MAGRSQHKHESRKRVGEAHPLSALDRVQARMEGVLPRSAWRSILAFLSGALTFMATTGGLMVTLQWAQSAIVAGIAVGLVAPKPRSSALIGALVALAGAALGPAAGLSLPGAAPTSSAKLLALLGSVIVCAGVAALANYAARSYPGSARFVLALAFLLLIGNLWYTTLRMNALPASYGAGLVLPSFNEQLDGNIPTAIEGSDAKLFYDVYAGVKSGAGFYPEYAKVLTDLRGGVTTVADYRTPTVFWLYRLLPNARWIVIAFLLLASAAILAVIPIGMACTRLPLVLPAAAALASYFLYFPLGLGLLAPDPWAAAVGVLALAAMAASVRSPQWRLWASVAVACAILAVLTREIMAFLPLAGLASAFFAERSQRRFHVIAWVAGLLALALLYGAHAAAAQPYLSPNGAIPRAGHGSLAFMFAALKYATNFLGAGGWLAIVLALLGVAGAFMIRDIRMRVFAIAATLATLASFLVLGNDAQGIGPSDAGALVNYWGIAVVPLLYALLPASFSIVPGSGAAPSTKR